MRRLPPLDAGPTRWLLPMADASAGALADLLLAEDLDRLCQPLSRALARDPPLSLWTVCVAAAGAEFRPCGVADVARWLARHAGAVLRWPSQEDGPPLPDDRLEAYADRIARAVHVADVAGQLAAAEEPATKESAFLLGLLHDPVDFLTLLAQHPAESVTADCLPPWLTGAQDGPGAAVVRLAVRIVAGEQPPPDSPRIDVQGAMRRAEDARRRWLAPIPGLGTRLPVLAARLARLSELEDRFQEVLEREKLEAMAEFAAGAGHEINNPLTVIAGRAHLFLTEEKDPERRRALALMHAQAMRVSEMIADMMLFARPPRPEPETIELGQLVDALLAATSPQAARQEITLCRLGHRSALQIDADATQLTVALRAICQNAMEAIGRRGRIEIDLQPAEGEMQIRIRDDGPGISPEQRRHLFDPYYSAREAGRGLGLGLSKAWRIITNHGGRIDVESRAGQGAEFTVRLPRRRGP